MGAYHDISQPAGPGGRPATTVVGDLAGRFSLYPHSPTKGMTMDSSFLDKTEVQTVLTPSPQVTKTKLPTKTKPRMHMMIDIETLGNARGPEGSALVRQIGWAVFDPRGEDGVFDSGCMWLSVKDSMQIGCAMEWGTIKWWLMQIEEARALMCNPPPGETEMSVADALEELTSLHRKYQPAQVWAKPPSFDLEILRNLYTMDDFSEAPHHPQVWNFGSRCVRTLLDMCHVKRPSHLIDGTPLPKHGAESDAIAQALQVQTALKELRRRTAIACGGSHG